jgi:hypothetical protein
MKHFALLFEVRKSAYPRRLKIEIKKGNRRYYLSNNFKLLLGKINELMGKS